MATPDSFEQPWNESWSSQTAGVLTEVSNFKDLATFGILKSLRMNYYVFSSEGLMSKLFPSLIVICALSAHFHASVDLGTTLWHSVCSKSRKPFRFNSSAYVWNCLQALCQATSISSLAFAGWSGTLACALNQGTITCKLPLRLVAVWYERIWSHRRASSTAT